MCILILISTALAVLHYLELIKLPLEQNVFSAFLSQITQFPDHVKTSLVSHFGISGVLQNFLSIFIFKSWLKFECFRICYTINWFICIILAYLYNSLIKRLMFLNNYRYILLNYTLALQHRDFWQSWFVLFISHI